MAKPIPMHTPTTPPTMPPVAPGDRPAGGAFDSVDPAGVELDVLEGFDAPEVEVVAADVVSSVDVDFWVLLMVKLPVMK
jgi:hypothetical protein